jgi:hypothetical protein
MTKEIAAITAVVPRAIARFRHWRAPANHRTAIPGVTFARSGNAHAAG